MRKLFSERYKYKEISERLNWGNMTNGLKIRIWNRLSQFLFLSLQKELFRDIIYSLWDEFFKRDLAEIAPRGFEEFFFRIRIRKEYLNLKWYEVYDFLEFIYSKLENDKRLEQRNLVELFKEDMNTVFEEENVPYRFINGNITPIINKEEIAEIESALSYEGKYKPTRDHLEKALDLLSNRKNPDYANSIKESISALESLVRIIKGEKETLGQLIKGMNLHSAFKDGLSKLYGWTSDEGGIRHGKTGEGLEPNLSEARLMLVLCSAFFNYLIEKAEAGKL